MIARRGYTVAAGNISNSLHKVSECLGNIVWQALQGWYLNQSMSLCLSFPSIWPLCCGELVGNYGEGLFCLRKKLLILRMNNCSAGVMEEFWRKYYLSGVGALAHPLHHLTAWKAAPLVTPHHLQHRTACTARPPATPHRLQCCTACNAIPPAMPHHLQG